MAIGKWFIHKSDLDEVHPPRTLYPYREVEMFDEQVHFLDLEVDSSMLIDGCPGTGKTVVAIMKLLRLLKEGKKCLYISPTSLSLKYIRFVLRSLGIDEQVCVGYYDYKKLNDSFFDVIIIDDANKCSVEQILTIAASANYLLLFGDFSRNVLYESNKVSKGQLIRYTNCKTFPLWVSHTIPDGFTRLIPGQWYHSACRKGCPIIVKTVSFEEQCLAIMQIVEEHYFEDIGILCYTRKRVKETYDFLTSNGFAAEAFLPGSPDGIDTIDFKSGKPKIMTITSSEGLHFKSVFVVSFDRDVIAGDVNDVIRIIATRPTENLVVFYENQLPKTLAELPQNAFLTGIKNESGCINY